MALAVCHLVISPSTVEVISSSHLMQGRATRPPRSIKGSSNISNRDPMECSKPQVQTILLVMMPMLLGEFLAVQEACPQACQACSTSPTPHMLTFIPASSTKWAIQHMLLLCKHHTVPMVSNPLSPLQAPRGDTNSMVAKG